MGPSLTVRSHIWPLPLYSLLPRRAEGEVCAAAAALGAGGAAGGRHPGARLCGAAAGASWVVLVQLLQVEFACN